MKYLLVSLFLSLSVLSYGQMQSINQTDSKGLKQGVWKKNWKNGKPKYSGKFKDGKPVGEFIRYNEKGKKLGKLIYFGTDGKRAAAYLYHENGAIEAIGVYQEKKKDSLWRFYTDKKVLLYEKFYRKGVQHGPAKDYYLTGQLKATKTFTNGVLTGEFKEFFENGDLKTKIIYVNGNPHGKFSTYWSAKVPRIRGSYYNGKKTGTWKYYSPRAKVEKEEKYSNGSLIYSSEEIVTYWDDSTAIVRSREVYNKNGTSNFKAYYPNGKLKREGYYKAGRKDSVWLYYTIAGRQDTTKMFSKGKRHGVWTVKYPSGKVQEEKSYLHGKLEGTYKEYYENGKVKVEGEYKKGQRAGAWKYYDETGKLTKTLNNK